MKFAVDLETTVTIVAPNPANTALHARILSRLGDSGKALAALGPALERDPSNPALRLALGQVLLDRKDYSAALAEANSVLAGDPMNKAALALKYSSEGRIGTGAVASGPVVKPPSRASDSGEVQVLVQRIGVARSSGEFPTAMSLARELMRAAPASESAQEIYREVTKEHEHWSRVQKTIMYIDSAKAALMAGRGDEALDWADKAVQSDPAPAVIKFADEVRGIVDGEGSKAPPDAPKPPAPRNRGIPLWPLLPVSGLGAAAYVVAKSRKTVESEDGFDEYHRPPYGRLQQFVAGAILAGLAGAGVYLTGAAAIPFAVRYLSPAGQQAIRLAQSETGAVNPRSVATVEKAAPRIKTASESSAGGLNLFKWGRLGQGTRDQVDGWKPGDHMLYLKNQGSPKQNWLQNARQLRVAMQKREPIYDSYRHPQTGSQVPADGFLKAERMFLTSRGWTYDPRIGAFVPPIEGTLVK